MAVALVPLAHLIFAAFTDGLGANPIETITHTTGDWTLRLLLLTLAVTPLRRLLGWNGLIRYRRTLGLLTFFYASLHFLTYVGLDLFFDWSAIADDVAKRPYVTAGFTAFVCMLPLAITSTRGWIRRLGRRWSRLHGLIYVAGIAAIVHYYWLVKIDVGPPLRYGAVLAVLLGVRLGYWLAAKSGAVRRAQRATAPSVSRSRRPA